MLIIESFRPNHEKILYTKLLRFREEQLENYDGPPMDYSMSDYHHNHPPQQVAKCSSTRASLQVSRTSKRQSQYSLLHPDKPIVRKSVSQSLHRRSSVAETEESYDPYRPSRTQIGKAHPDKMRVTVLRDASQQSARKPSTRIKSRESTKNAPTARIQDVGDDYSIASTPPAAKMHSAGASQFQRLAVSRRISRGSSRVTMASRRSNASNSSAVMARKSTSYKRNVSFVHNRRRPFSSPHPRLRSQEYHIQQFTLQERFLRDQARAQTQSHNHDQEEDKKLTSSPPSSRFPLGEIPEPEAVPILRSRKNPMGDLEDPAGKKARMGSHHFRDEARKVSTEMEKLCDEAFNKIPVSSSVTTPGTTYTGNRDSTNTYETYRSSTTSFSVHEDPVPVGGIRQRKPREVSLSYQERPLPKPPATERRLGTEHLGSYTQRELAKARDLLKKRAAEADMAPGYLDEVIAHLDRLMQPSSIRIYDEERRAVSTPDPNPGMSRKDTFEQILEKSNIGFRSASEPTKKNKTSRGQTVRLVDSTSGLVPISPVKPLTIRKRSESSTPSAGSPQQITQKERLVTTEELYRQQADERLSAGLASLSNQCLDPIEEDEDKENFDPADRNRDRGYLGESRKRHWFRRRLPAPALLPVAQDRRASPDCDPYQNVNAPQRKSDVPSEDSQTSEAKTSGKIRFFKIFSGKRNHKESRKNANGDYDLDDNNSLATEDSSWVYNPAQAYMSGALPNSSVIDVPNRGSRGSKDDKLMPPPPIPRVIQPQPQNWLARFLRIKPAVNVLCFQVSKMRARKEVAAIFREWRKYGMRDIMVDKVAGRIWARVDVKNCRFARPSPFQA